jgi:hypothetical protein
MWGVNEPPYSLGEVARLLGVSQATATRLNRELSLQNVPHWFPVNTAGFHRYLSHTELP